MCNSFPLNQIRVRLSKKKKRVRAHVRENRKMPHTSAPDMETRIRLIEAASIKN